MKSVLFILHEYYPYGSAITNCINPIIEKLKEKNIDVTVVTRRTHRCLRKYEILDGVKVYRVNDYETMLNNEIEQDKSIIKMYFHKVLRKLIWLYKHKIEKDLDGYLNKKRTLNLINSKIDGFDTIISCSYPMKSHKIANEIKKCNNKVVWIAYQFDPHSFNHTLNKDEINLRMNEEIEILGNADKIFLPIENYKQNIKTDLVVLKDKYRPIEYALIKERNHVKPSKTDKIVFAFAGTLYDNIRTPFHMLDFFKNIDFNYELNLCYITSSAISEKLQEYKRFFGDRLVLHENKSKDECDEILGLSNIIVNIGNDMSNQTPSKVFEYINYCKPIINFYSNVDDTSKRVLSKYPLVLNIFKDYTEDDVEKFVKFCKQNSDKVLSFKEATKDYKTSEELAEEFISEVSNCFENK